MGDPKMHHLGIACSDIDESIKEIAKFHKIRYKSEVVYDCEQKASVCLVKTDANIDIEFISGEKIAQILKKGITYYHICFEVENLDEMIEIYLNNGAHIISSPKPAVLFGLKRVAFLYISYGLVELLEK